MERHPKNPLLTRRDVPNIPPDLVDVSSVFNPGAIKAGDRILLMLRVQDRGRRTHFLMAESRDGAAFKVGTRPVRFRGLESVRETIYHCYDARLTALEGAFYVMFAMDMDAGCRLGLARTADFESFDFLGVVSDDDTRNGVLFPEKVGGRYLRYERPNKLAIPGGATSGTTIVLSASDDLLRWRQVAPVFSGRFHYWDELIGAGPPPVKTREGWLLIYHGVATHLASAYIYQAGVALLDLNDPARVVGRCPFNILEPRELYECVGQVPNVVFPSGLVVESTDEEGFARPESRVLVYYGAADTCVGLATARVQGLVEQAKAGAP
jgi:beta-1,4-mannooligosaccharide/beta-1,4-mannosyl-N-acetylglucosamine phosphorylase